MIEHLRDSPWGWAVATAAACALAGGGTAYLAFSGFGWTAQVAWVAGCAGVAFALAGIASRRWASRTDLLRLAEQILSLLDGQSLSLQEEHRQIERLQAAISDEALRQQIHDQLAGSAQPNLAALIGQLTQAEEAVPAAAPVTRSWISHARQIACHTRLQLEQVREDVGGK